MPTQVARRTRRTKPVEPEPDTIRILSAALDVWHGKLAKLTEAEWDMAARLVEQLADQDQAVPL